VLIVDVEASVLITVAGAKNSPGLSTIYSKKSLEYPVESIIVVPLTKATDVTTMETQPRVPSEFQPRTLLVFWSALGAETNIGPPVALNAGIVSDVPVIPVLVHSPEVAAVPLAADVILP
jgi:hypothetical protein